MKQYIKKALWIIPFVFSLNLSATTWYFVNANPLQPNKGSDLGNWNDDATGLGNAPGSTSIFTDPNTELDLNEYDVDFDGMTIGNIKILNSAPNSVKSKMYISSGGTLEINTSTTPTFDLTWITNNFISAGTIIYSAPSTSNQYVLGLDCYNLLLQAGQKTLQSALSIHGTLTLNSISTDFQVSYTITLESGSSFSSSGSITFNSTSGNTGSFNDLRSTKIYTGVYNHNNTNNISSGTYSSLNIRKNCSSSGNITITSSLEIGDGSNNINLNMLTYTLTTPGLSFTSLGTINLSSGTLEYSPSISTSINTAAFTSNSVKNLTMDGSNSLTIFSNTTPITNFNVSGNLYLKGSGTFIVTCGLNYSGTSITRVNGKLDVSSSTTFIKFNNNGNPVVNLPNGLFLNNQCYRLTIDFPNGGTLRLGGPSTQTIVQLLLSAIPSTNTSYFDLNGYNILVYQTASNVNGCKIIGNPNSTINLIKTTSGSYYSHTLYFDQSSTNNYSLHSLYLTGYTNFTLGSNLIVGSNSGVLALSDIASNLNINGKKLTLNGDLVRSNSSSVPLTVFIGSLTSELEIAHDSALTENVKFSQITNNNRTLKNLTITNGANVSLANWLYIAGGTSYGLLTVNAASTFTTNNYLILKADVNGYAQVANSSGTISGNLHVQTYFPGTAGRGYRFISSQVVNGTFYSLRDSGSVASGGPTYGAGKNRTANVGIQITGTSGSSKGFDVSTTNNPSAFSFNEANAGNYGLGAGTDGGWSAIADVSASGDKLVSGKGYRVLIRGDRTINLTGTASNNIATTTQITGTYPSSPVQTTITNSGSNNNNGINLVGNPYPANLSWTAIKNANTGICLDAAYAVYDVVNGRYNVYSASAGTGTASDDIAAGQGFLVYTCSTTATLSITESCKNTAAIGDRYFKKQRSNHLAITMSYDTLYSDKSIIYFLPGSTTSYDEFDAGHIQNPFVNLSSLDATNSQYALNCLDTLDTERTVPLSFKGTAPGDFSMTFEDCGTFQNNDIYLFDKFLNKKIKIDDWTKYDFSITTDPFTAEDGRLSLFFKPKENNSLNAIEKTTEFNISPNPVNDYFTINHKLNGNVKFEYSIVNTGGQEVKSGIIQTNEKINAKDLARGIYFMTIKSQNESQTIKFIK